MAIDKKASMNDGVVAATKMYPGDIFLKHSEEADSTHIAIRENNITLHTQGGTTGMWIQDNGIVNLQGKIVLKASGSDIEKGMFTENGLSFISQTDYATSTHVGYGINLPHSHGLQPAYKWKIPFLDQLKDGALDAFEEFKQLFV